MHSMRPPLQSAQSFQTNRLVGGVAGGTQMGTSTIGGPILEQQEQSAFEMASSAAARVTATGTAAAAMAAAKFKMLRSNTLAAAFGNNTNSAGVAAGAASGHQTSLGTSSNAFSGGTYESNAVNSSGNAGSSASRSIMAMMRTKDDKVVNTLTTPANRSNL